MKEFQLTDKVILITGANGLIGREVADALASAGANLAMLDSAPGETLSDYSHELSLIYPITCKSYRADITDTEKIKVIVSDIATFFGKIDVLINLAAIDAKFDENIDDIPAVGFEDFPMELWKKSVDVNLTGTFNITQQVVKQMLIKQSGNIINVGSTYSLVSPNQNLYKFDGVDEKLYKPIDYVATKSMIPNFTRYIATYYAKQGIRSNTIIPHGIVNNPSEQFKENFSKYSPLGRMCQKEELRGPFIFLASDSSSYMTGSTLIVDGGWTAW